MDIVIRVIPEEQQRKEVSGADWFWDADGNLQVRVSPMSDWRMETILAIHEVVEAIMCKHTGVTQQAVDVFDQKYYETHTDDCNAGDDPAAPYKKEHTYATAIERILAGVLDVDWFTYDKELATEYPGPLAVKKPT